MGESPRILHVIGGLVAGGAERLVVDLLPALQRLGVVVELGCLTDVRDPAGTQWRERLTGHGIPIHVGPHRRLRPGTIPWLARLLAGARFDVVHLHLYYVEQAYYLSRWLHRRRYQVLRTIHNTRPSSSALSRWALRHSDIRFSIACGRACFDAHRHTVRGEIVCIPNGVAFDWASHDPAQRASRLGGLRLDPAETHYLHVGRQFGPSGSRSQKAQDDLIRAWRREHVGERGGRLHLLGDGPLRAELEALAADDPSILFHGVVPNVHEWLAACDTFVMPSRWEGLPIAALEALGTGIVCIFSDIPPLREIGHGVADFVEPGDVAGLSRLLAARLGRREGTGEGEVARLRQRFGIDAVARAHLAVYDQLLQAPGPDVQRARIPSVG